MLNKTFLGCLCGCFILASPAFADDVEYTDLVNISGSFVYTDSAHPGYSHFTGFSSFSNVTVGAYNEGVFSSSQGAAVTMNPFTVASYSSSGSPAGGFSFTDSHGTFFSISIDSLSLIEPFGGDLQGVHLSGISKVTGYSGVQIPTVWDTNFDFTINSGASTTFSASFYFENLDGHGSSTGLPDGGSTLTLLGAAALALGYARRKIG